MSASNVPFQFALLDLPNELIGLIIEHIASIQSLRRLARTCRRLQQITEPVLYRSMLLRTRDRASQVLRSIAARSERGAAIHFLDIPCDNYYPQSFRGFCEVMRRSPNLKEVMIESPECNGGEFEDEEEWTDMTDSIFQPFQEAIGIYDEGHQLLKNPLQNLRKLTLHLNGAESPYWSFDDRSIAILLHPTLESLTISCVNILSGLSKQLDGRAPSPLRNLELIECNISHVGLYALLSLPQALESLYLGENCHNIRNFSTPVDPESNHLFQVDPAETVRALGQQKESLRSFTYVTTETYYQHLQLERRATITPTVIDGAFADFYALEKVSLIGFCPSFERALMTSRSPPNLQVLESKSMPPFKKHPANPTDYDSPLATTPFLRAPSCSVPGGLRSLSIAYDGFPLDELWIFSESTKEDTQKAARAAAKLGAGIDMIVSARGKQRFFPPYLWQEPRPAEILLFGGVDIGYVRDRSDDWRSTAQSDSAQAADGGDDDSTDTESDSEYEEEDEGEADDEEQWEDITGT